MSFKGGLNMDSAVDLRDVDLLKRQLKVLNYQDEFHASSYELVKRLVTDLVHTTETYQSLKQQSFEQHQEIASFRSKMDAIKKDAARVVRENNSLHVQLIQREEETNAQQATHYQRIKELESEIGELSFWKHQATTRMEQSEKGASELKERLADLLKMGTGGPPVQDYGRLTTSCSMNAGHVEQHQDSLAHNLDVLQAVEQRLAQTQQDSELKEAKLAELHGEMELLKLSLKNRDAEVERLSAKVELGREADVSNLSLRNETNEAIILSLNQQVDVLSSQAAALEEEGRSAEQLMQSLKKTQDQKRDAEEKLSAAINENSSIQEQVAKLQLEVSRIKADTAKKPKTSKFDDGVVLQQVTNLQSALDKANASQEQQKSKTMQTEKQREASLRREVQLRNKIDGLRGKLERAEKSVQIHERKVEETKKALVATKQREEKGESLCQQLQASLNVTSQQKEALQEKLNNQVNKLAICETERAALEAEVDRLRGTEAATTQDQVLQRSTIEDMLADKERLLCQLAALKADRASLQEQLQEAVKLKTNAVTGETRVQGDHARLLKEVDALQQRLTQANAQLDSAISERDQFELHASKSDREIKLIHEERRILQEDLHQIRQQWQEHRERLSAREGELDSLSGLRDRSEALEAEMKSSISRLSAAEAECSRLRTELERWRKVAGDEEDKALSAQAGLREAERRHADSVQDLRAAKSECDMLKVRLTSSDSTVAGLTEEKQQTRAALELRDQAIQNERIKLQDLEYKLHSMQHTSGNDRQSILCKEEELSRQKAQLDECQKSIQTWQDKHRDAVAQLNVTADKARQHAVLADEYKKDLESTRLQLEDAKQKYVELQAQASRMRSEVAAGHSDVEQLKSLVLASNRSQSDLESRLSSKAYELRTVQSSLQEADDELKSKNQQIHDVQQALKQSKDVVRQLDSSRDQLQADLDEKEEQVSQLESVHKQITSEAEQLEMNRKSLEHRLTQADKHISHLQHELHCSQEREQICKQNLVALQQDHERVQDETAALSEDLAVMVKENQLVTGQLGDATQQFEEARKDGNAAHASVGILQQTVKARDIEVRDMRAAYEGLAAEARHSEATISQLRRQLTGSATELEGAKAEIKHARETAHSSQQQIQQYVVDVQALERNSDALARELQSAKSEAEEVAKDRTRVLEQMQVVQGMRYEAERSRDNLQQEVARLDSQLHISNARLEEAHAEVRKCTGDNAMLQNRISEFERLTETMREKEFSLSQVALQSTGDGTERWKEKCGTLQLQVHMMEQEICDAHRQIESLRLKVPNILEPVLQISDQSHPADSSGKQACDDQLEEARTQAAEALQELAIVRRQLDLARTAPTLSGVPANDTVISEMKVRAAHAQQKVNELEEANNELRCRAHSLKDDKERLLRMVSRLELERHHLQSLQAEHPALQHNSTCASTHMRSRQPKQEFAQGQLKLSHGEDNVAHFCVGALTELIELNDAN